MTYHITRHAQIVIPEILRAKPSVRQISAKKATSWFARFMQAFQISAPPENPVPAPQINIVERIAPYADWDAVFLPYAVESFHGVKVKDAEGNLRKAVRLNDNSYVELRLAPRTSNIDYSLVEAQQF